MESLAAHTVHGAVHPSTRSSGIAASWSFPLWSYQFLQRVSVDISFYPIHTDCQLFTAKLAHIDSANSIVSLLALRIPVSDSIVIAHSGLRSSVNTFRTQVCHAIHGPTHMQALF